MSEALRFFSDEWAAAAAEAVDRGPTDEMKAAKLDQYWEWVERARGYFDCTLALGVRPDTGPHGGRYLLLTWADARCTEGRIVDGEEAAAATYVLEGDEDDWLAFMAGYDAGKTVMYRKLLLVRGDLLEFFKSIYLVVESLACIQRVPTQLAQPAAA